MLRNPFVYKGPLEPERDTAVTIPRTMLKERAIAALRQGHWLTLCSPKKAGKTSFLLDLFRKLNHETPAVRFFLLRAEDFVDYDRAEFYRVIQRKLSRCFSQEQAKKDGSAVEMIESETAESFFERAGSFISADDRLIIALDGLENTPKDFVQGILRDLINLYYAQATHPGHPKIQFIISGCMAPADLRIESGSSFSETATKIQLDDFQFEAIDRMVHSVSQRFDIPLHDGFTRLLYQWTAGTAYLVQKICYQIYERAQMRNTAPAFDLQNAEDSIAKITRDGETTAQILLRQVERRSELVEALVLTLRNHTVRAKRFDPVYQSLLALGAVSLRNGRFRVRNALYEEIFRDYFTTEKLANMYCTDKNYQQARELVSLAATQENEARSALRNLLLNLKSISECAEKSDFFRRVLRIFERAVDGVQNCSFMYVDRTNNRIEIVDAIGLSDIEQAEFQLEIGEGVAGSVAQTGRTRLIRDVKDEVECPDFVYRELAEKLNIGAMLTLPLSSAGKVIGLMNLCLLRPFQFSQSEVMALEAMAHHFSAVLEKSQLAAEAAQHHEDLNALQTAISHAGTYFDVEIVFERIMDAVRDVAGGDSVYCGWKDHESGKWKFKPLGVPDDIEKKMKWPDFEKGEGSGSVAIQKRQPQFFRNVATKPRYFKVWENVVSELAVPLVTDGEAVGCLVIGYDAPGSYSETQARLISLLASIATIAIKKDKLYGIAVQKTQELITVNSIGEVVSNEISVDELLSLIAKECLQIVYRPHKSAFIYLWDKERKRLTLRASRGDAYGKRRIGRSISLDERSIVTWVMRNRASRSAPNVKFDAEYRKAHAGVRSEVAVPLIFKDEILGVLDIQSTIADDFHDQDVEALNSVANSAASAIKITELTGKRLKEFEALYNTGTKIASSLNEKDIMRTVCREGLAAIGAKNRTITMHVLQPVGTSRARHLKIKANGRFEKPGETRIDEDEALTEVLQTGQCKTVPDVQEPSRRLHVAAGTKSAFYVPISFNDRVAGVLVAESERKDDFGETESKLLTGLANQAGVALENARLNQHLKKTQVQLSEAIEAAAIEEAMTGLTHDIKNISSLIAGEIQWLRKLGRQNRIEPGEIDAAIQKIQRHIAHVEAYTNDLHKRAAGQRAALAPKNLGEVVEEAVELVEAKAARSQVEIYKAEALAEVILQLDAGLMVRAFLNILTNAIDAMQTGGVIRIEGHPGKESYLIEFVDNGSGISSKSLNKVLDPFVSTKQGSYGLGLALTRRIIEMDHRGKIVLKSEEGQGTTVRITLPYSGSEKKKRGSSTTDPRKPMKKAKRKKATTSPKRILVVNDEPGMLRKIESTLQRAGFVAMGTELGREAVEICAHSKFDAILMDYHLKKDTSASRTAFDFIPIIRSTLPAARIILTSASLRKHPRKEGKFDHFIEINAAFWDNVLQYLNQSIQ